MHVDLVHMGRCAAPLALGCLLACGRAPAREEHLSRLPLDSVEELITRSGVEVDASIHSDARASIRIDVDAPATVRIAELEIPPLEDARLIYRARLRSEELRGQAYLEMWCVVDGRGEFFSRALHAPLTGTQEWTSQETPFFLKKGEVARRVKLNLVIDGEGSVWIDDARLLKAPL